MRSVARITGMLLFIAVGLLNLVPGVVALAPSRLATAYGVVDADVTSTLLLRHPPCSPAHGPPRVDHPSADPWVNDRQAGERPTGG
ncbi:hypothetical protein [Nonomuraea gerenzanensis]|uniref:Uncharacterized protein n=1 Tax=Nonomuraea gerenzanensis TaxID=93944 RepID=A0A1M4DY18_9ACTN|nr:hypothetical protein [Nonomuraea gerenzanensis]UBU13784.1 hypothetical protein LCN96_01715 [Nonomuraea gerenzanensis]SBO91455.1 hypothetical protein BN4615_P969 [Nonomuraea gerenzanensis]